MVSGHFNLTLLDCIVVSSIFIDISVFMSSSFPLALSIKQVVYHDLLSIMLIYFKFICVGVRVGKAGPLKCMLFSRV